eukprot:4812122-Alexandrium_andersonii.AAC.1
MASRRCFPSAPSPSRCPTAPAPRTARRRRASTLRWGASRRRRPPQTPRSSDGTGGRCLRPPRR